MKSERNKRLGRESLDRARALCASNDKPLWTPFNFVAKDVFKGEKPNWRESLDAINAKIISNEIIFKMMKQ